MRSVRQNSLVTGPVVRATRQYKGPYCTGEDLALVDSRGHGRYYEQASRGQVFSVFTALAGTTIIQNNCVLDTTGLGPPAGGATILSLLNPVGSGLNLEIIRGWAFSMSAVSWAIGVWGWTGQTPGVRITAAEVAAMQKRVHFVGQGVPHVKAWSQTALTGGLGHTTIRPFVFSRAGAGEGSGNPGDIIAFEDNVDGAIVVPEGAVVTIAPLWTGAATSWVVGCGMQFAEVPLPQ